MGEKETRAEKIESISESLSPPCAGSMIRDSETGGEIARENKRAKDMAL